MQLRAMAVVYMRLRQIRIVGDSKRLESGYSPANLKKLIEMLHPEVVLLSVAPSDRQG